jgi:hypothetical protein
MSRRAHPGWPGDFVESIGRDPTLDEPADRVPDRREPPAPEGGLTPEQFAALAPADQAAILVLRRARQWYQDRQQQIDARRWGRR